jgi:WD40 repeat protein
MITSLSPACGSKVIVTRRDNHIALWDAATGLTVREQPLEFWPRASRVAADGTEALLLHEGVTLVGLPDMHLKAETGGRIRGGISKCAAFAPDGKSQIIGNYNGDIFITSQNGDQLAPRRRKLAKSFGQVQGVEVLRDQRVVIVAGSDGRVDFISWDNEARIGSVDTPGERLTSMHVSPNGDFMAVGDTDSSMSFWDLRVMQLPIFFSLPFAKAKPAHLAAVQALACDSRLPASVRHAVTFMGSMLRHRFRFDIEIAEMQSIRVGEFDIAIE